MYEFLDYLALDVMNTPVTLDPQATLAEAERVLESRGFDALPVVDGNGQLLGLVGSLDLLAAFDFPEDTILPRFEEVMQRPVSDVMRRDVLTICPRTPLTRVLSKLVDTRHKSLPVVEDGRVVGIVARADLMLGLRRATSGKPPDQPASTSTPPPRVTRS